jgi:AbrB family looped-hinge helix DNA binding protein
MAFPHGKIPFVNATAEIDKAGRLVVPKKLRDALHLVPGTRVVLRKEGEAIVLEPEAKPRGLSMKNGFLVYSIGRPLPPESVNWVEENREERDDELFGR